MTFSLFFLHSNLGTIVSIFKTKRRKQWGKNTYIGASSSKNRHERIIFLVKKAHMLKVTTFLKILP